MEEQLLLTEKNEKVFTVTINRPERRNALNAALLEAACEAIAAAEADHSRRVLILRGAGPMFCSGLDLVESADASAAEEAADWVARMLQTVTASPLVTIAAAHGGAYAGGT